MTELVKMQDRPLAEHIQFADYIAKSSLVPSDYRGKPADIVIATGLGAALGLSFTQSLYEIHVVNGKPGPSANLIAGKVREAGHKLRIKGDDKSCTAQIIRKDDPDHVFEATWTIQQAEKAKLTRKDVWQAYPSAMLRARAVTEVARAAASEALLGMEYSKEELLDMPAPEEQGPVISSASFAPAPKDAPALAAEPEPMDAEVVEGEPAPEPPPAYEEEGLNNAQRNKIFAMMHKAGFTSDPKSEDGRNERLAYMSSVIGREITSTNDLTHHEAGMVLTDLTAATAKEEGD